MNCGLEKYGAWMMYGKGVIGWRWWARKEDSWKRKGTEVIVYVICRKLEDILQRIVNILLVFVFVLIIPEWLVASSCVRTKSLPAI